MFYHLPSVWQIPPHNKRHLLLSQLLDGDLQGVGLAFDIDKHGRIHTVSKSAFTASRWIPTA